MSTSYIRLKEDVMNDKSNDNKKCAVIENILEEISMNFTTPRSKAFGDKLCVMCGGEAKDFRDALSKKEYSISGMCQGCQDSFFE